MMTQANLHGLAAPASAGRGASMTPLVITQAAALACVGALAALAHVSGLPFSQISRDPATALGGAFVTGYLSYLGACLWCASAAVALFSAALLGKSHDSDRRAFFLTTGLLGALLLVDDLFMLHDGLIPHALGGRDIERAILAGYLVLGVAWLVRFRSVILEQTRWPLLLAAGGFFGVMAAVDAGALPIHESRRHLVEDGTKFLGIVNWAAWVIYTCASYLKRQIHDDGRAAAVISTACAPETPLAPVSATSNYEIPLPPSWRNPARIARLFAIVGAAIFALGLVGQWLYFERGVRHSFGFIFQFDPNGEGNLAGWYASTLLLYTAWAFAAAGRREKRLGLESSSRHWIVLAVLLMLMSLEETAHVHDMMVRPLREMLGAGGLLHYTWVIPGGAAALLVFLLSLRFLRSLPARTRRGLLAGGGVYLAGALGAEMLTGAYVSRFGEANFVYALLTFAEEGAEIAGTILLGYVAADHLRRLRPPSGGGHSTQDAGAAPVSLSKQIS